MNQKYIWYELIQIWSETKINAYEKIQILHQIQILHEQRHIWYRLMHFEAEAYLLSTIPSKLVIAHIRLNIDNINNTNNTYVLAWIPAELVITLTGFVSWMVITGRNIHTQCVYIHIQSSSQDVIYIHNVCIYIYCV